MACLDDNALTDLVEGTIGAPERQALFRHLEACPPCRRTAACAIRWLEASPSTAVALADFTIGRYVVRDWLGEGAMGVVYRAYDPQIDRDVALKLVGSALSNPAERGRALHEARALGRVSHPNVLAVFDAGELEDAVFVATELVDGCDLRAHLDAHQLDVAGVIALFRQAAVGLAAAHRAGVVHLDVKPENLLVDADGRLRVADFGLAAAIGARAHGAGTRGYMAPEQRGRGIVDARADQYALCCTLVEALWGATHDPARGVVLPATCRRGAVPQPIRRALQRGLATEPSDRFADMDGLAEALTARPRVGRRWAHLGAVALIGLGFVATKAPFARSEAVVAATAFEAPEPDPALAHARSMRREGRHDEARAEAERVAAQARVDGDLGRLAEAELIRAKELGPTADHRDAVEIVLGAMRSAAAAGRPDLEAEALLVAAFLASNDAAAVPRAEPRWRRPAASSRSTTYEGSSCSLRITARAPSRAVQGGPRRPSRPSRGRSRAPPRRSRPTIPSSISTVGASHWRSAPSGATRMRPRCTCAHAVTSSGCSARQPAVPGPPRRARCPRVQHRPRRGGPSRPRGRRRHPARAPRRRGFADPQRACRPGTVPRSTR
ncbi:MAG: serine/threonine protein kinase [Deltaproteobacteria bacterium]|nr:serine/threonine protein kinase [Deltaproteobacteria bacterium]